MGKEKSRGFSGLSDLTSEVGEVAKATVVNQRVTSKSAISEDATPSKKSNSSEQNHGSNAPWPPAASERGRVPASTWVMGSLCVFLFLGALVNITDNSSSISQSTPEDSNTQSNSSTGNQVEAQAVEQNIGLQYTKPSIGTNNLLTVPMIRWCIREGISVDTMRDHVNTNSGIYAFNQVVGEYNSRCGSYQYREGSLARAELDVERYRASIIQDAIQRAYQLDGQLQ